MPAIVVSEGNHYDIIYGAIPLRSALEAVAYQGTCKKTAQAFLEKEKQS